MEDRLPTVFSQVPDSLPITPSHLPLQIVNIPLEER